MADSSSVEERLDKLLRHIKHVQDSCQLLGKRLIAKGEVHDGMLLIAQSMAHDQSKFSGIEWLVLSQPEPDKNLLKCAVEHHQHVNSHHPEYWGGAANMPPVCVAEMVCDWYARSNEFGTDLREWIKSEALARWAIPPSGKVNKMIAGYVSLLLETPLKKVG